MRLAIRVLDPARIEMQMAAGEVDIAFATREIAPPSLRARALFHERYVLIGRRDHPKLKRKLTQECFAALEHVIVSPSGGAFSTSVDETLAALGLSRKVVLSASSFLVVPEIVAKSGFVALVPERLLQTGSAALKRLEPPLPVKGFDMLMVWHERAHNHPALRWMREQIVAVTAGKS
jgi:DNA-binding transcriptional LysR family regulator